MASKETGYEPLEDEGDEPCASSVRPYFLNSEENEEEQHPAEKINVLFKADDDNFESVQRRSYLR